MVIVIGMFIEHHLDGNKSHELLIQTRVSKSIIANLISVRL